MLKFQWSRAKLMVQSQTYALLTTIQPSLTAQHIWKVTQMTYRSCGDAKEFRHEKVAFAAFNCCSLVVFLLTIYLEGGGGANLLTRGLQWVLKFEFRPGKQQMVRVFM